MVTDGGYTYHGEHLIIYMTHESLGCSFETNIILYIKYISIKNDLKKIAHKQKKRYQSHKSSGKCKLEPQQHSTIHLQK